jgi:hypothetical protein
VKRRPGRGSRRQADGEIAVVGRKAIKARVDRGAAAVRAVHGLKPGGMGFHINVGTEFVLNLVPNTRLDPLIAL